MNITILANNGKSSLKLVGDVLLVSLGKDSIVPEETPNEFLEDFAKAIIAEVSRVKTTTIEHAKNFVDLSTFDEIVQCLRAGNSHICDLNPGFLAQLFCHISTK